MLKIRNIFMRGLITTKIIITHICVNICVIKGHLNFNMKKLPKYLDTFYFNFNNYLLIIKILIKDYNKKNDLKNTFVIIV
jgi:hypothetical protein